ncbi:MAG: threonine--tRNA ligase, partial [Candidatus Aenigmarchaeota archaeon]|nr:threonine--tRNA ligase [Candidatus Aenigmarchaeota archaeon]
MKILLTHSDFIEYEAKKKALPQAEEGIEEGKIRIDDCLVVFTSAEEGDDDSVVSKTVAEIEDVAEQVTADKIVIYPFVHLSQNPAKPAAALKIIKKIASGLQKKYKVYQSPFGWYKSFTLKCKGHPLSELSREIKPGAEEKREKKKEDQKASVSMEPKELAPNDHRILGRQLDLYSFHEYAPGMAFFHPKGVVLRNVLLDFWRKEHYKAGYSEISTPQVMNQKLWETSGHWDHYKDNMFFTSIEDQDFALKPMNCPGAILVFKSATRSYRELPLRLAELGIVHRNELSGVLSGLFRLRAFTQDDAHIFATPEQLEKEILRVVDLVASIYSRFGFEYHVELSTRPDNAMGEKRVWDIAERALEDALKSRNMKYKLNPGDGAFYGPKIDFHVKDSLGRTWQCATVQVDFMMPERFDISYVGEDNSPHRPVIIHRVIYGAIERFIGILVEHYSGSFPTWLAPEQ